MTQPLLIDDAGRNDEAIDYFAEWPELQFSCWLAGFFDGEGNIYLPKSPTGGVNLSISNTNRDVIESIQRRTGVGYIDVTTFTNQPKWRTKYTWRVRRFEDVTKILTMIEMFVTIKADAVAKANARIIDYRARRAPVLEKHERILELAATGLTHTQIAEQVGGSRGAVSSALKGASLRTDTRQPLFHGQRHWVDRSRKQPASARTETTRHQKR